VHCGKIVNEVCRSTLLFPQPRLRLGIGDGVGRTTRREEITNLCCGTGTGAAGSTLRAMAPLAPTAPPTFIGAVLHFSKNST